jgi:CRISPR-associated endonuclease/helicase Cas3
LYYAHSRNSRGHRQDLVAHLHGVADLAGRFASEFDTEHVAQLLGLWHDLGKFNPTFQEYLLACEANPSARGHGPDHKAAGAKLTGKHLSLAALLVQGHHGGLKTPTDLQTWLAQRGSDPAVDDALRRARRVLPDLEPRGDIPLPAYVLRDATVAEFFLRMLFSALVDADFLDTERHFNADRAQSRGSDVTITDLWERFEHDQQRYSKPAADVVSQARHAVYNACLDAAMRPPGLFRLAVPTGGGKTRSAMAFALRHALHHGQQRVIVAVPFISITEQTADTYRAIFASLDDAHPVVLEHHTGASGGAPDDDDFHPDALWARLAAENWDAPTIVTTTVQLFESLFASSTSRSRKNHRLARSVIILDEAQALPSHLLAPMLDALRQLCAHYGTTVVLSTATQPAFDAIPVFASVPATEIVPDSARLFEALCRIRYEWRTDRALSWPEVAQIMGAGPSVLAVLNTKRDALSLLDALGDPDALHLSTLLCGAHRRKVLAEVRERLAAGEPCRLVSTQVIEAGVDLDFPLVLRALGPLDGIIQAAGRCNREGRLEQGHVIVFRPEQGGTPQGVYRTATGITGALLGSGNLDPDDPATSRKYFERLFKTIESDREGIQKLRAGLDYPEVARRFRMIEDDTESVVVPYGSTDEQARVQRLLDQLRRGSPQTRLLLRHLQPYLVSVRARETDRYRRQGLLTPVMSGLGEWLGAYDPVRGLTGEDPDPDTLVV